MMAKEKKIRSTKLRMDEFYFTAGVSNLVFSTFLLSRYPHCYWIWHTIKMSILLVCRYLDFKARKLQFFLLDYCYTVNFWSFLYLLICYLKANIPMFSQLNIFNIYGPTLFRVAFSWCVGPLALSVLVFRNSLVFHSSDHLVILAVHYSPNLAFYGLRWFNKDLETTFPNTFHISCNDSSCGASFTDLIVLPIIFYIILWTIPYSSLFFVFGKKTIEDGGYHTMYETMKNHVVIRKCIGDGGPYAYMFLHLLLCSVSYFVALPLWGNFYAHTAYLIALLVIAIHNGGTYYFEVFADRNSKSIE